MWTVTGPFDKEAAEDVGYQKTKLLKTGASYTLGRKDCALTIVNKKVSSNAGEFVVKKYSVNDVGDPTSRPALEFINKRDKGMRILRDGQQVLVNPLTTQELKDGDILAIISSVQITVKWVEICCYFQPIGGESLVSLEACASLGMNLVYIPNHHVTHHLIPSYTASPLVAASLLSACQFVKPEWLVEVVRLGELPASSDPSNGLPLEQSFILPPTNKFRPAYSASLSASQKEFKVWEPNEERLSMFSRYRFLCVDEKARELNGDFKDLIKRGGGSFETFDPNSGKANFHRALARGQAKEGIKQIVVGKQISIQAAVGRESWKELVAEAKDFGIPFVEPQVVIQVVVDVDVTLLSVQSFTETNIDEAPESSTLPSFIPNTHPDEPSIPPPEPEQRTAPPRKLVRRTISRGASQEATSIPSEKTPEPEVSSQNSRPRRALTRRVNAGIPVVTGLDDPSSIFDSVPELVAPPSPPSQPVVPDLTAPTPVRSTRLKRRVVGGTPEPQTFSLGVDEVNEEPPLKKFKALFEASGAGSFDENAFEDLQSATYNGFSQTQTQSQTQGRSSRPRRGSTAVNLSTLREEEEETQISSTESRGTKRPLEDIQEDVEMNDIEPEPGPKKRAVENLNGVERTGTTTAKPPSSHLASKPPSTAGTMKQSKGGASPGKPDQDTAFLKAIASTKRGKKTEDEFDRDFNKLKISKPNLEREEPEEEWALLEDFGNDTNIRGNFMVVVEMPVYNRRAIHSRKADPVPGWEGKPNFKKFNNKKRDRARTNIVQLVISEENGYGMGPSYWKGGNSQDQSQGDFAATQSQTRIKAEDSKQKQSLATKGKSQALVVNDSDEDIDPPKGRSKPSSRAGSAISSKRTSTRSARQSAKPLPLFVPFGEDDEPSQKDDTGVNTLDEFDDDQTLQSSAGIDTQSKHIQTTKSRAPAKAKKSAPILADDDSDDGAVFKGFQNKRKGR